MYTYGDAYGQSQDNLSYNLVFAGHPLLVFPEDLDIIVRKAETAQPYQSDKQQLNVHVGQISEQQYCYENGAQDEYASHRGSAFLGQLSFQTQVPDLLSELLSLHVFYELLSETENQYDCRDARQDGAHGDVLHDSRTGEVQIPEMFEQMVYHSTSFIISLSSKWDLTPFTI